MGERKVQNKYYSADFDPAKIPKIQRPINHRMSVRSMILMSIRCANCGNYMKEGTKRNMKKENVVGEKYLGRIQIFRFYFTCIDCPAEIIIKTDPRNSDYAIESGAIRMNEPWREEDEQRTRYSEENMGVMEDIEKRRLCSKRQIDNFAELDERKSLNSRYETVGVDAALEALPRLHETKKQKLGEEDEPRIISLFGGIRRIHDHSDNDDSSEDSRGNLKKLKVTKQIATARKDLICKISVVKKRIKQAEDVKNCDNPLQLLCKDYDNSVDDSD